MKTSDKRQPAFGDLDKMPFGQHRDLPLQDVPAHYLNWLKGELEESGYNKVSQDKFESLRPEFKQKVMLYNYIHNCYEDIKKELDLV